MEECTYNGIKEIVLEDKIVADIYNKNINTLDLMSNLIDFNELVINQYLLIKDKNNEYLDRFRFDGNKLVHFPNKIIDTTYIKRLRPRNIKQQCCFDLLLNNNIPVKLITGGMGAGKTYLALHIALKKIEEDKEFKKVVYVRNNIEVKDTNSLGALPNGIKDKLLPYILPISDCLSSVRGMELLEMLEKQERIEYLHLGWARGRNFSNSIVICSESENLTREHVALLIGRIGENSSVIFEGDTSQVDKKIFSERSGIKALKEVLKGNPLFGCVHMDKSERSKVAELSNLFYEGR